VIAATAGVSAVFNEQFSMGPVAAYNLLFEDELRGAMQLELRVSYRF
jgi:hypothetical protein